MKRLLLMVSGFLLLLAAFGAAQVCAGNITINDTMGTPGVNVGGEDQEVEPNCLTGQVWDLEAFKLSGNNLTMIGGFNFKAGYGGYEGGDIFISTTGTAKYGATAPTGIPGGVHTIANVYGYNYAIKMDFVTNKYTVYAIGTNSLLSVFYAQNSGSNPWQLVSGEGTKKYTGDLTFASGLSDAQTGFKGGSHYSVELASLADYLFANNAIFHYTMECGNDDLMGRVPIPPTVLLFGTGVLGLGLLGFRRKRIG
jgi:hypothetical protein